VEEPGPGGVVDFSWRDKDPPNHVLKFKLFELSSGGFPADNN